MAVTDVIDPALTLHRQRRGLDALSFAELAIDPEATELAARFARTREPRQVPVAAFNSYIEPVEP